MDNKEPIPTTGAGSIFLKENYNCLQQALRYLTIREHNRAELRQKLLAKGYESPQVDSVLDSLVSDGSLSEARYVQSFVRSNNKRHPEGKAMLLARLTAKGTDKSVARCILDELYDEDYTSSLVLAAYEKLVGKKAFSRGTLGSKPDLKAVEIRTRLLKLGFSSSDLKLLDLR